VVAQAEHIDEKPWSTSDLVMINPTHYSVALKASGDGIRPRYQVVAKAADALAKDARRIAWETKIPILGGDTGLTRRVFSSYEVGQALDGKLLEELALMLRPREFVPLSGRLVAYFDTRNRARRVGHLLSETGDAMEFSSLVPIAKERFELSPLQGAGPLPLFKPETVSKQHVQPGSLQFDLNESALREQVDFLDYCVYHAITKLQSNQYRPIYLLVDVMADIHQPEIGLEAVKAELAALPSASSALRDAGGDGRATHWLLAISKAIIDLQKMLASHTLLGAERKATEQRLAALRAELQKMRSLIDQENRLKSEIRSRLVRAGVPQVERSERAKSLMLNQVSGKTWLRPGSAEADDGELLSASHVLLTELRTPEGGGRYQLSMRLIDVYLGTILWEDQSDRAWVPAGGGSTATLAALNAREREEEETRRKKERDAEVKRQQQEARTPAALVGTWHHTMKVFVGGRRVNQTIPLHLLPEGKIQSASDADTWEVEGTTLVMRALNPAGIVLEYRGELSEDRRSYSGTLQGTDFSGRKVSDGPNAASGAKK
jgi:hypothetical protein